MILLKIRFFKTTGGLIMNTEGQEKTGFVPEKNYDFTPSVETNCMLVSGGDWYQAKFASGWCLKFENGTGVFQGKPSNGPNQHLEHFFKVDYGKGSSAQEGPIRDIGLTVVK